MGRSVKLRKVMQEKGSVKQFTEFWKDAGDLLNEME
jgi:hypothetical protein